MNLKLNKIIKDNQEEVFPLIPDDSIDMTFADPPFNLKKLYNTYSDNLSEDKYIKWTNKWLSEMVRITKPTGSIFVHNIPKWAIYHSHYLSSIADFKNWISWRALSGPPNSRTLHPTHYAILFFAKDKKQHKTYVCRRPHLRCRKCNVLQKDYGGKKKVLHRFGPMLGDVWIDLFRVRHKKHRDSHPCQLPIHLLERLILMTTDENDIVFDPFIGTGTTAIAAKRLGRNFLGCEKDLDYYNIANEKIKNAKPQKKINGKWVSWHLGKVVTLREEDWDDISRCYYLPDKPEDIDKIEIKLKSELEFDMFEENNNK